MDLYRAGWCDNNGAVDVDNNHTNHINNINNNGSGNEYDRAAGHNLFRSAANKVVQFKRIHFFIHKE